MNVHLGKYDRQTQKNCKKYTTWSEEVNCAHPTVEVGINKTITHPTEDIALIRLSRIVYYTDYIVPICLPSTTDPVAKDLEIFYIAGWGKGK